MVDAVVIGAGINGSWSALHLARNGHRTLLIEQVYKDFLMIFKSYTDAEHE